MKEKNQITEGVIWKQIIVFFFPIMIGTLFQQLYNTADAVIVGRFVGKEALASVGGSVTALTNLVIGFFTGLSSGATVIISQYYGARDRENVQKGLHTAYAISIAMGLGVSAIGWFGTPWILRMMNTPAEILTDSILYLRIYFAGLIATLIYNMGSAIMRAVGDSRRPLYYLMVCCVLNILLDVAFVVGLDMGIAGAAIATVISQVISAILVTFSLMRAYTDIKLYPREIGFDRLTLKREIRIGLPSAIQTCIYNISNIIIQAAVNGFGTDTAAAWGAYGKMDAIFWSVTSAFGIAVATFAGQNYGAGKGERVYKSIRSGMIMALIVCGSIQIVILLGCHPLLSIFTTDKTVVAIGVAMIIKLVPAYTIAIVTEVLLGALRGLGDVLVPTLITLASIGLVRLPWIMLLLPRYHHVDILLYSYIISWSVTAVCMVFYYFYRKKRRVI